MSLLTRDLTMLKKMHAHCAVNFFGLFDLQSVDCWEFERFNDQYLFSCSATAKCELLDVYPFFCVVSKTVSTDENDVT